MPRCGTSLRVWDVKILGVASISILSRDPNLFRKPSKTQVGNGSGFGKERWLKRMEKESNPRKIGLRLRKGEKGDIGSPPIPVALCLGMSLDCLPRFAMGETS